MKFFHYLFFFTLLICSQTFSQDNKTLKVQFEYIGQLELNETKGLIIADVSDISTDQMQNIYICDRKDHTIKVFDKDRKYLREIGQKGKGPGELLNPKNITISSDNKIYVWDSNRRISVFKTDGTFVESYDVRDFYLNDFCVSSSNMSLFCSSTAPPRHFPEKIDFTSIYILNMQTKQWSEIGTMPFMGRINSGYQLALSSIIKSDGSGKIIFATGYPYQIELYSQTGVLEKTITRSKDIPKPVEVELAPNINVLVPRVDIRRIIPLPNRFFMAAVADMGKNVKKFYEKKIQIKDLKIALRYDLYNQDGEFIQSFPIQTPLEMGMILHCDSKNQVYSYFPEWETPNIKIYKMTFL